MADFVQNSQTKNAVRKFSEPIADVSIFNTIVQSVITDNPFACVSYMTAGETHDPIEITREGYTARIVYENGDAKTIGNGSHKFDTIAGFNAGVTALLAAAAVTTAHGGTVVRNNAKDSYSATLKCHDPNGELYFLTLSRDRINLTSYSDESVRTKVETWADTVPVLA